MEITTDLLSSIFINKTISKAKALLESNIKVNIKYANDYSIKGHIGNYIPEIKNEASYSYYAQDKIKLSTNCTCKKKNCVHAAALALYYLNNKEDYQADSTINSWLNSLSKSIADTQNIREKNKSAPFELLYILYIKKDRLCLSLNLARRLKSGKFGSDKKFVESNKTHQKALTDIDQKIMFNLNWQTSYDDEDFIFYSASSEELLKQIIQTQRCFFLKKENPPIKMSKPIATEAKWTFNDDGSQYLTADCVNDIKVFKISTFWYLSDSKIGLINTNIDNEILKKLIQAPPIPLNKIKEVNKAIGKLDSKLPQPTLSDSINNQKIEPIPCLHLSEIEAIIDSQQYDNFEFSYRDPKEVYITVAKLFFKYGKHTIASEYKQNNIFSASQLKKIYRDFEAEIKHVNYLSRNIKLKKVSKIKDLYGFEPEHRDCFYIGSESEAQHFINGDAEKLKSKGWIIKADDDYDLETFEEDDLEWYSELGDSEYDWFSFNLGVMINNQKVNLLPLIVNYLKENDIEAINNLDDSHKVSISLNEGRNLLISASKIKSILAILTELYDDRPLNKDNLLILPNLSASQLTNLEDAIQVDNFSWLGSSKIRNLGDKIKSFSGVKKVNIPKDFKADLRPYQQQGVNWLRFLNEYEFGGILADDMGLGKTIQTLANLVIEQKKNPEHPSIIIAPTSLIANWVMEAEKFAPSLKVLALHGDKRKEYFNKLDNYDVIVTSYP